MKITNLDFQRNGVAGNSFYSCKIDKANGQKGNFLATFEVGIDDLEVLKPSCRIINLDNLSECWDGRNIAFDIEKQLHLQIVAKNKKYIFDLI